jgi:hypothetical protein
MHISKICLSYKFFTTVCCYVGFFSLSDHLVKLGGIAGNNKVLPSKTGTDGQYM